MFRSSLRKPIQSTSNAGWGIVTTSKLHNIRQSSVSIKMTLKPQRSQQAFLPRENLLCTTLRGGSGPVRKAAGQMAWTPQPRQPTTPPVNASGGISGARTLAPCEQNSVTDPSHDLRQRLATTHLLNTPASRAAFGSPLRIGIPAHSPHSWIFPGISLPVAPLFMPAVGIISSASSAISSRSSIIPEWRRTGL